MTRLKKLIFNIFCYSIFLFCMCICMCTYISSTWCSSICCLSLIDDVIGGNDDDDRSFNEFISRSSSSAIFVFQWERSRRREIDRNKRNTLNVLLCGLIEKEKNFFSFSFFLLQLKYVATSYNVHVFLLFLFLPYTFSHRLLFPRTDIRWNPCKTVRCLFISWMNSNSTYIHIPSRSPKTNWIEKEGEEEKKDGLDFECQNSLSNNWWMIISTTPLCIYAFSFYLMICSSILSVWLKMIFRKTKKKRKKKWSLYYY